MVQSCQSRGGVGRSSRAARLIRSFVSSSQTTSSMRLSVSATSRSASAMRSSERSTSGVWSRLIGHLEVVDVDILSRFKKNEYDSASELLSHSLVEPVPQVARPLCLHNDEAPRSRCHIRDIKHLALFNASNAADGCYAGAFDFDVNQCFAQSSTFSHRTGMVQPSCLPATSRIILPHEKHGVGSSNFTPLSAAWLRQ